MDFFKERRFSIDPGKGKKMDGCPYSIYEDGRDVKEYIIPPKGYIFKGFRFDPDANNQIYDGMLIAEYEKEPFNDVLKSNLWKVMLAVGIIAVVAVVVFLALSVFKDPKPSKPTNDPKPEVVATDTVTPSDSISEVQPKDEEPVSQPDVKPTEETSQPEEPQPTADDPSAQFKKDFWNLVHQRTIQMDPYDLLYKDNKATASGEEYDYLRFEVLKDTPHFKEWSTKLRKIPANELESINTVNDLKNKLKEIQP